jgi:hypothetical protein
MITIMVLGTRMKILTTKCQILTLLCILNTRDQLLSCSCAGSSHAALFLDTLPWVLSCHKKIILSCIERSSVPLPPFNNSNNLPCWNTVERSRKCQNLTLCILIKVSRWSVMVSESIWTATRTLFAELAGFINSSLSI